MKELLQRAGLHAGDQTEAKRVLRELVRDGVATRDGKRYALAGPAAGDGGAAGPAGAGPRGGRRRAERRACSAR